jgi:hypothetical protein
MIRHLQDDDVAFLASRLRESDVNELSAVMDMSVLEALCKSVAESISVFVGEKDGNPICIGGICAKILMDNEAEIWMVGTNEIESSKKAFLRGSKIMRNHYLSIYPKLSNYIDVRNKQTIAWLKFLGAQFDAPAPYGIKGLDFMRFELTQGGK